MPEKRFLATLTAIRWRAVLPLPALENAKVRGQTLPALLFKGEGRSVETPFKSDCTDTETPVAGEILTAPT